MTRKCDTCGQKLPSTRHFNARYCDEKCAKARYRERAHGERRNLTCAECGGPRWSSPGLPARPWGRCQACRSTARRAENERIKAARTKDCKWCGGFFDAENGSVQYCSDECRVNGYRRQRGRSRKPYTQTTAERGYGHQHQKVRARLLAELVPGTLCAFCDEPMLPDQQLDLDHSDSVSRLRGEPGDRLTHASCNRRAGARLKRKRASA